MVLLATNFDMANLPSKTESPVHRTTQRPFAQDIIFEVMPNGRLASLTLYSADGGRQRLEGGQGGGGGGAHYSANILRPLLIDIPSP